jgi:peptidoglycan/xylan/chitin deacetylase (PgdA/CDA1 family)
MTLIAQPKQVAITIDDIPNVGLYAQDSFRLVLLEYLEEKQIPAAIFVNESRLFQNEHYSRNFDIYLRWLKSPGLTVGNHTYEHLNYSDTTFAAFQADILKGEAIAAPLLKAQDRELKYFRFPFNSLGEDSLAHAQIMDFLHRQGYQLAPHTISSEDWMYNALYENFLAEGQEKRADSVGQAYVRQTMKLFAHYGQMSEELYDRQIRQIYLCHDNALNRDYLPQLLDSLQEKQYELISMEEALQDEVYQSEDYYFGRWGFSWVYRWLEDSDERQKMLRAEPFDQVIYQQYQALTQP